jgi:hypothetical protein
MYYLCDDVEVELADGDRPKELRLCQVVIQISILIVDNGLEYTALSKLWRVPLTRATNANFAHHYELRVYIIIGEHVTVNPLTS